MARQSLPTFNYSAAKLVRKLGEDDVANALEQATEVRNKLAAADRRMAEAERAYEAAVNKWREDVRAARKQCSHLLKTYYPDASGNNDSHYECDICGAEV